MRLVPEPSPDVRRYLENVCERVCSGELPHPPWVAVDEGGDDWVLFAARQTRAERARAVVATSDENSLLIACRLGIGGAVLLPPSTPATEAALSAAASNSPRDVDVDLLSWCSVRGAASHLVTWNNVAFWRHQLGGPSLCELLRALADRLGLVPTMLGLPALLVPGSSAAEIESAWRDLIRGRCDVPSQGLRIVEFESDETSGANLWMEAARRLAGAGEGVAAGMSPLSIYELPQGRRVGHWSADSGDGVWSPRRSPGGGLEWVNGESTIVEAAESSALGNHGGGVVRVPGWLAARLRPGAPNGVLVERLAGAAKRRGMTLWVPNVDQPALDHLLRQQVSLWVDGPAVPD